jgi:aminoglycoside phosphotransferase (APT) family kinase protein
MHENEFDINELLVGKLLNQQFPEFAGLKINQVKHAGTDNAIFRLGEDKCIRLPRVYYAAEQIEKELKWLPKLRTHLPLAIPEPIAR